MSWNIHSSILLKNKLIKECAILRKEDEKILTKSKNLNFSSLENNTKEFNSKQINKIIKLFFSGGTEISENGYFICKKKYYLLNFLKEDQIAFFKCKNGGATICASNKFLIIGVYEENSNQNIYKNGFFCNNDIFNLKNLFIQAKN